MVKRIRQTYRDMALPVKASIWFVVCGVLKDAIDVLVTPIFTRILTTEQYGVFNVYNSWFQIAKIIFTLYLFSEVFNVGLVKFEKDRDRFVSATLGFVTASVSVYLTVYLLFHNQIDKLVKLPWYLSLLLFVHVLVYASYYCWIRRERYDYHYKSVVIVSFLYVLLQPLTGILAIVCLDIPLNPGHTRIIFAVGVQIVIGSVLYVGMMCRGRTFYKKKYWKYSIKTGMELVPFNLSKVVLNQSDRIMINSFSGPGDTAIYSVAHSAAFVLQALTEALNGAFVPWLYRKLKAGELGGIKNVVNGLMILIAVGVVGIDMIAPEIMIILGDKGYYQGVYCIPALVYSVYLIFAYTVFANLELFYGRNLYVTAASVLGMTANIILNAIFIPRYGFIAAGYTTVTGYLVICAGHLFLLRRCLNRENIKIEDVIDLRVAFFVSAVLLAFTLLCGFLYRWQTVRRGMVVLLVMILFASKNKWLSFVKKLKGDNENG